MIIWRRKIVKTWNCRNIFSKNTAIILKQLKATLKVNIRIHSTKFWLNKIEEADAFKMY